MLNATSRLATFQRIVFRVRNWRSYIASELRIVWWRFLGANIGTSCTVGHLTCNWPAQLHVGEGTSLNDGVVADYCWGTPKPGPSIVIGDNCYIGRGVEFNVRQRVELGNDCLIAAGVRFIDHDHGLELGTPIRRQVGPEAPIKVGEDVWIGANAIVLKGVSVGDGAIVAAGAVVVSSIPPLEIWGGVPAKRISSRRSLSA